MTELLSGALRSKCNTCRWRAAVRVRAYPNIQGESRTCRSRPVAAGSLRGAAAPREVVISAAVRRPFSLSPDPTPTECNVAVLPAAHEPQRAKQLDVRRAGGHIYWSGGASG